MSRLSLIRGHEYSSFLQLDFESLPKSRQQAVALAIVRRETGIMAVSALVILGLAIRAATTGG